MTLIAKIAKFSMCN